MKAKINIIYLFAAFSTLFFLGCQSEGPQGPAGLDGQNAEVYYSEWITPSVWDGVSGDWYFSVAAPDLTEDVVEGGVVLAYVSLAGDIYEPAPVRPLPAFAVGANWSFLIFEYGSLEFTSDMNDKPLTTGNNFRFVVIPSNAPTLKSASLKNVSESELKSMPYTDVCKLFGIPE